MVLRTFLINEVMSPKQWLYRKYFHSLTYKYVATNPLIYGIFKIIVH